MSKYILSLDQGTTSSRAILFDHNQKIIGEEHKEFNQIYPAQAWVEHDPMEIFSSQYNVMSDLLKKLKIDACDIAAIGITNQRETTILWDKKTGVPIYNAIVWQCRRTSAIVDELKKNGLSEYITKTTGLIPDAYFSGTKIKWILDNVKGARERAQKGEILFGTVDTWLIWKLSGGKAHVTDYTNASRTMIFDIHKLDWDDKLLNALDIPRAMLPEVKPSGSVFANAEINGVQIPIAGNAGDQQAALFGQCCFEKGEAKCTYGTGCFLLMNTGTEASQSKNGLLTTIAAGFSGKVQYALEGSVFTGGAVIQWLRDELRIITGSEDSEYFAQKVNDTGGVYLVPAFTGLGAPYWDMYARGCLIGITRGTKRAHIIRAAQESIAYQVMDLLHAMETDLGFTMKELKVDGGASRDKFLMQFQSDICNADIIRPVVRETTALGAACLAGITVGFWQSQDEVKNRWQSDIIFKSEMDSEKRIQLVNGWHKAVGRSRDWA
ncbi:MAG: glycerol kinase GlpK [Treponema sp.]|nr:glycerol kinase GlpK [Treponema sp.]MCL2250664.1 glycerol kinase GlpK [Treponema sp.]